MKKFAIMAAVGVALACGGAAYAGTVENAYNNTVVVTTSAGVIRYHFNADGTYTMTAPDGHAVSGTFTAANGEICLTPQGGAAECGPYEDGKNVGDVWTQSTPQGDASITIQAGR